MIKIWIFVFFILIVNSFLPTLYTNIDNQKIEGTVVDASKTSTDREKYMVENDDYKAEIYSDQVFNIGDKIIIEQEFEPTTNEYMLHKGVSYNGFSNDIVHTGYDTSTKVKMLQTRGRIQNEIINRVDPQLREYANSLFFGEDLSENSEKLFSDLGIMHIFALSGLHVGIILKMLNTLMPFNNYFVKILKSIVLFVFYIIGGQSTSLFRSVFTGIGSLLLPFKVDKILLTMISAIFLIINNPFIILNLGFQLSYGLTIGIILFVNYHHEYQKIGIIKLSIFATLLANIILSFKFTEINFMGIVANIIISPIVAVIIVPGVISISILYLVADKIALIIEPILIIAINSVENLSESVNQISHILNVDFNNILIGVFTTVGLFIIYNLYIMFISTYKE